MTVISRGGYNADNQLTLWGSQGFLYDLNGNMTADGNNAYSWNVRNQLVALTPDGGTADTFVYDAFGRRQKKVINGTETDFLFDQNGNLAAELTDGGEYFTSTDLSGFGADELVCRYTAGVDGGLNQPLMALTDINGSVVGLVADGGVIQATYAYEPYGATQASGTDDGNSQQFTGRENDGTGVHYYRARYYMPEVGRFLGEDPIGFSGGINMYMYAAANPEKVNDPTGLDPAIDTCTANPGQCTTYPPQYDPNLQKLVNVIKLCLPALLNKKQCNCFCGGGGTLSGDGSNKVKNQYACQGYCDTNYPGTLGICK
jgi:RHS repeat-associated protein